MARKASARSSRGACVDLFFHGAEVVDDERWVELVNGLANCGRRGTRAHRAVRTYTSTPVGCF